MSERTGRHGFKGSPITDWCGKCQDFVVRRNDGRCCWCDARARPPKQEKTEPSYKEKRAINREARRLLNEQRDARIVGYMARGFSDERIARYVGLTKAGVRYRRGLIAAEQEASSC